MKKLLLIFIFLHFISLAQNCDSVYLRRITYLENEVHELIDKMYLNEAKIELNEII